MNVFIVVLHMWVCYIMVSMDVNENRQAVLLVV